MDMNNSNNSKYNRADNNINNISPEDIGNLELLNTQKTAQIMFIYSDILSYISTLEGIELIYSKYNNNEQAMFNPDIPALQSAYLALFGKVIITEVGFTRYNHQLEKFINGQINYSLEPNVNINIGNSLGLISYLYLLSGAQGIYQRDLSQPVFGI